MQIQRLTDKELLDIIRNDEHFELYVNGRDEKLPDFILRDLKVMACEILEYRMSYGDLGCEIRSWILPWIRNQALSKDYKLIANAIKEYIEDSVGRMWRGIRNISPLQ